MAAPGALVGTPFEVEISTIQTDLRGLKTACAVWKNVAGGFQGLRFATALTCSCQSNRPERLGRPDGRSSKYRIFLGKRSPGTHVNSMRSITSPNIMKI